MPPEALPGGFKGLVGFTFALAVSGFVGWENSGALAEESRDPRRYNIALPLHVLATDRARFRPVRHILIPLAGSAVLLYGVYEFIQPNQPPPANGYWKWILAIVVIAAAATAVVYARRPDAIKLAGTIGPEFVQEDT
jgi:amino acid transporter